MIREEIINGIRYIALKDVLDVMQLPSTSIYSRSVQEIKKIKVDTTGGKQELCFTTEKEVAKLICNTRKISTNEKIKMLKIFNLNEDVIITYKETEFMERLSDILKAMDKDIIILQQYRIDDKYRIDMFLPDYGLCVEYDEYGHKSEKENDNKREEYIKKYILENYKISQHRKGWFIDDDEKLNFVEFIRVDYKKENEGIGKIIKHCVKQGMI